MKTEKCCIDGKKMRPLSDKEKESMMPTHYKHYGKDHDWFYCDEHDIMVMNKKKE